MAEILHHFNFASPRYNDLMRQLSHHALYDEINTLDNLKIFMQHHVFAVWDFMSLIKSLQQHIAPSTAPWMPPKNARYAHYINQLVLEEESDQALVINSETKHASHFESYLNAMREIGADTKTIISFLDVLQSKGLEYALNHTAIPKPAKAFMHFTFSVIQYDQPHLTAAAFAYGREDLVPHLFKAIESGLKIKSHDAPNLHAYLKRHIQLDGEQHGPLSIQLLNDLCGNSNGKKVEAMNIAEQALKTRLMFWDGIQQALIH